ncbi:MAG: 3-dehydroquinate synthase [Verrucomicrobiales bacterium]|nr:3-dehydroquinate synthase [Verrucomicrobiales bacterium]
MERDVRVTFRHQVHFTDGVFGADNRLLRDVLVRADGARRARALVVVDDGLAQAQPSLVPLIEAWFEAQADAVELVCSPLRVEGGERVKNAYFHVSHVHEAVDRHHIDRHNYLLAVGGGALLDMVGLAAATAHRGVRHVRLPTTTLAQADSGVGVKNGINAFGKKNFVGTFAPPYAVINDFAFLDSLPDRDRRAGLSEAVKVACIRDVAFFEFMEQSVAKLARFDADAMRSVIHRSAELHLNHIANSGDPFEFGSARPLDFGHWSAHKLEPLSDYRIRHGEAVAIGVALDVIYSRNAGWLDGAAADRVLRLLEGLGFSLYANELHYADSKHDLVLLQGLEEFREHLGGQLTITLLKGIGAGFEVHEVTRGWVVAALEELRDRHRLRPAF